MEERESSLARERGQQDVERDGVYLAGVETAHQRTAGVEGGQLVAQPGILLEQAPAHQHALHRQAERCMFEQNWDRAAGIYQRLVSDFKDRSARPLLRRVQEEIRLAGLFDVAMATHQAADWDNAVAGWS